MKDKKIDKEKKNLMFAFLLFGILIFISGAFAVGEQTFCCEKTKQGAWCQNVDDLNKCETSGGLKSVPTSCEATSYCKLGTCVNTQEGVCMENTPQRVCENPVGGIAGGLWFNSKPDEIQQCKLGCCLIGEQAAFTTQTRCEQLSSLYGLETNYRTDIQSETECISSAFPETKGACVFDEELKKSCRFTTKKECQDLSASTANAEFHENFLCSSEELGTVCGPSEKTAIYDGEDEIFFIDTCGNRANIFDADRQDDRQYWDKVVSKSESCGFNSDDGNANSNSCGNCDYLAGSTGALYDRFRDGASFSPKFGNYICRNLDCRFEADLNGDGTIDSNNLESGTFKHGESWCAQSAGVSQVISDNGFIVSENPNSSSENIPGSRYFRMVCYNGDVTVEPCADFRQEICIQSETQITGGVFRSSACRVNKWQDCLAQQTQQDCENFEKRDCVWKEGYSILKNEKGNQQELKNNEDKLVKATCIPKYVPGLNFYQENSDADSVCVQASRTCTIKVNKNILGSIQGKTIQQMCDEHRSSGDVSGCECLENSWLAKANNLCVALGDCGVKENYIGEEGFYEQQDLYIEGKGDIVPSSGRGSQPTTNTQTPTTPPAFPTIPGT